MRTPALFLLLGALLLAGSLAPAQPRPERDHPFVALSAEERGWLEQNRDNIILSYDAAYPPLEFQDKTGNYAGVAADIVAKVEKLLGVRFVKRPTRDWNVLLGELENGTVHLNGGMVRTPERERYAYFTTPYITLPLVIITTTRGIAGDVSWNDLAGRRVGVVAGYASETFVRQRALGRFEVVTVKSVQEGLRDVSFGVIDAFVDNLATSSYYIEKDALANLRVAGTTDFAFPLSISVSRQHPLLYSAVQRALSEIRSEEIEASRKHWISLSGEGMLSPETVRLLKFSALFVGLLLVCLAGISYYLKRRLNEKVETLRLAQQEIVAQAERLGAITSTVPVVLYELSATSENPLENRFTYVSEKVRDLLGVNAADMVADPSCFAALVHPDDRDALVAASNDSVLRGGVFQHDFRVQLRDGAQKWVRAASMPSDPHGGAPTWSGYLMDITASKLGELALAASEAKYRAIFNNAPIGVFRSSFGGGVLEANPALARMHGYGSVEEFMLGVHNLGQQVYARPEDRQRLLEALLANPSGTRMDMDFRRTDGAIIHTILNAALHRDETGAPSFIDGTIEDITERKRAGLALRQSEENYRELFESAPVGIFQTTPDGRFFSLNPEYARIAGYASPAQMIKEVTDIGAQLYVRPREREAYKATLERLGQVVNYEAELKRRDGEPFWVSMNTKQKRRPNGDVVYEGFLTDITERKKLELRLADQLAFQEALLDTIPYPVFYKGSDTRFIGFNKAYEEVFGVRREELIGKRVLDLEYLPEADRLAYQAEDEAIIADVGRVFKELPIPFADGALHQTLYSVTGFRLADGTSGGLIGIIVDITERKQAEERLRESEERYRSVIQNMQDVYYRTDTEGRLTMVSPSGLRLFGYDSLDEVLGRRTESFYTDPAQRQALLARLAAEGVVREYEILLRRKDGTPIQAATTASFYRDAAGEALGVEGIFRDITERKQAEEALRQSEEKFSRIFEMAPECITFVRLRDAVIIDANAAFETITGHSRAQAIGRPAPELGIWDDPASLGEFMERLNADAHVMDFEFLMRRKDGVLRRVVNSAQLVPIAGEACYVSVIHDITDERRMQELLIQSEKMMSVGSLAAGIAHEINNPLGIVHQAVQNLILRTSPDQKKNQETAAALGLSMDLLQQYLKARKLDMFLEDIQAAAMRASGIIRNMLNFSRRSESRRQTCDLKRIIEQSVFLASSDYDLKKSYDFKRIEIVQDLQEVLPACSCTETEIEQVILNLLRNAAQAMALAHPPTQSPRITLRLRADEAQVRIEVEDNGPGMDPDVQRKVFEPFFTTKPPGVGTGLGLSVSYFIITKGHAGRMWLTSSPGRGTTFFIELPADPGGDDHA